MSERPNTLLGQRNIARLNAGQQLEKDLAQRDAHLYGTGYLLDGIRVDPAKISVVRRDQEGGIVDGAEQVIARAIQRLTAEHDAILPWESQARERRQMLHEVVRILRSEI